MPKTTKTKEYVGSCYIGVVGPEIEIGEARDSIEALMLRPGDTRPMPIRATKGYEARNLHLERWLNETTHPFCFLIDHDMKFQRDALERLRAHKQPYITGYYLRRRYSPLAPVWFEYGPKGRWPMKPYTRVDMPPEDGSAPPLVKLGASGWGCMLLHRDVALAVKAMLHGEALVLEDDMDVWPYDLGAIMAALGGLRTLVNDQTPVTTLRPALASFVEVLEKEWRPLRGLKDSIGSDLRFPFYAREAGFTLVGDPTVMVEHMLHYPLSPMDYAAQPEEMREDSKDFILRGYNTEVKRVTARRKELTGVGK